jgi:peptidyl-tRNA hydrolase
VGKEFPKGEMAQYVLSDFSNEETEILNKSFSVCRTLTEEFVKGGIKQMMDANSKLASAGNDPEENSDRSEKTD